MVPEDHVAGYRLAARRIAGGGELVEVQVRGPPGIKPGVGAGRILFRMPDRHPEVVLAPCLRLSRTRRGVVARETIMPRTACPERLHLISDVVAERIELRIFNKEGGELERIPVREAFEPAVEGQFLIQSTGRA